MMEWRPVAWIADWFFFVRESDMDIRIILALCLIQRLPLHVIICHYFASYHKLEMASILISYELKTQSCIFSDFVYILAVLGSSSLLSSTGQWTSVRQVSG